MTVQELDEKRQQNLQAEMEAAEQRRKKIPPSFRVGPNQRLEQAAGQWTIEGYKRVKNGRWYAVLTDPVAYLEFSSVGVACMERKYNVVTAMEQFADVIEHVNANKMSAQQIDLPAWLQYRPEAPIIPEVPRDKISGLAIRNPWLKPGTSEDAKSREYIRELSPRLAVWLEKIAKNGGQPSMAMVAELESAQADAKYINAIVYGEKEWQQNLLRKDSSTTLTQRSLFAQSITDPYLRAFHEHEAKFGSPRLHFDNLQMRSALAQRDPALREIHKRAGEIFKAWEAEAREKAAA